MTLTQFDVTGLLDAIRAGGDIDVIRKGVELVLQALIETEATEVIGAQRYERTEARTAQRNGSRDRLLSTKAGDVELKIPKLRKGSFFPSILERRRRIDRARRDAARRALRRARPLQCRGRRDPRRVRRHRRARRGRAADPNARRRSARRRGPTSAHR